MLMKLSTFTSSVPSPDMAKRGAASAELLGALSTTMPPTAPAFCNRRA